METKDWMTNPAEGPLKLGERTITFHLIGETRFSTGIVDKTLELEKGEGMVALAAAIFRGLTDTLKNDAQAFQSRIYQTIRKMGGTVEVHVETAIRFVRPE